MRGLFVCLFVNNLNSHWTTSHSVFGCVNDVPSAPTATGTILGQTLWTTGRMTEPFASTVASSRTRGTFAQCAKSFTKTMTIHPWFRARTATSIIIIFFFKQFRFRSLRISLVKPRMQMDTCRLRQHDGRRVPNIFDYG